VDRAAAGDREAFEVLYARHYERVYAIARGVLLDPDDAADATQEVFALVHRNVRRFDRRSKFSTWLYRVAVNRSIQHARRLQHRRRLVPLDRSAEAVADPPAEEQPTDPRVESALGKLAPADRAVLTLFYWDDLSVNEMAEALGCSPNAAKVRLFRARERFRACYEEEA
jgi:RNA polymerase sigma-70 factor (ECF subfamily)